jgi:hypothetical protein
MAGCRPSFEGDLSTYYLTLKNGRYFVAQLLGPGDVFRKPLLPQLYEPVLTSLGNGVLVLRGFEREGEPATVQEWRCELVAASAAGVSAGSRIGTFLFPFAFQAGASGNSTRALGRWV